MGRSTFGIGGAFFEAGIPAIGYLTGPNYLVQITPNASMDKLNDALFARQVAWFADLLTRYDKMSAQETEDRRTDRARRVERSAAVTLRAGWTPSGRRAEAAVQATAGRGGGRRGRRRR